MTKTLAEYIQFEIDPQTYGSDLSAERLIKAITTESKLTGDELVGVDKFARVYSCTEDIVFHFDGTEKKALREFKQAWDALGDKPNVKQIEAVRLVLPYKLMALWVDRFNAVQRQELFDVPDDEKPLDMLDDEKREEAQQPNSFSPNNAALSA